MKRTSGRVGVGLVLVSLLVGACLTDGEKNNTSAEMLTQPEVAFVGAKDPKSIVSAVRTQLDRAFVGAKIALPESKPRARAWHSFNDVGALVKSTTEFLGNTAITGEQGKVAAEIALPTRADGAFRLRDQVTGMAIDVGLVGATSAAREETNGYVVYPAGYAEGAHIIHRPTAKGTEDYVFFSEKLPPNPELRYKVKLSDGVAGLRLVGRTIEMLNAAGSPRLRMAPPYAIDGDGRRLELNVAIDGCAHDTSLAPPWDRPTVDPGARECTVRLTWSADAKAPLVVDPVWSLTNDMAEFRLNATAIVVPTNLSPKYRVIVVGGDKGDPMSALKTTELFDDAKNEWSPGPDLSVPRTDHAMISLAGTIHVIGGRNGGTYYPHSEKLGFNTSSMQLEWKPVNGTMGTARARPAVITNDQGKLFVFGGFGPNEAPSKAIDVYDTTLAGGASWVQYPMPGPIMTTARKGHAIAPIPNLNPNTPVVLNVLISGGLGDGNSPLTSMERCWQPPMSMNVECAGTVDINGVTKNLPSMTPPGRANHVAIFDNNPATRKVFFFGGDGQDTIECYNPFPNSIAPVPNLHMESARSFFTVTSGGANTTKFLIVGGMDGQEVAQASTEYFDTSTEMLSPGLPLVMPRARHATVILPDKRPLVIGGTLEGDQGSAETLHCTENADCPANQYCSNLGICTNFKAQGDACDLKTDCWGDACAVDTCSADFNGVDLQCVDGFCCNAPCSGTCEACDGPVKGACTPTTKPRHGTCGEATDPCMGRCDGVLSECLYPAGKQCRSECAAVPGSPQSTLTTYTCDDTGACVVPSLEVSCGNYTCSGTDACNKSCDINAMPSACITGYQCNQDTSTCIEAQFQCGTTTTTNGGTIEVVESVTMPPRIIDECNGFKCDPITVQCLDSCSTAYDCSTGFTCDTNHACVPENFPPNPGGGETVSCSVSPAHESSRWGWIAALAFAGAFATRRNRARARA